MNLVDQYCLDSFPEMLDKFDELTLKEASEIGSYIFHEDFFNAWLTEGEHSSSVLKRAGKYIEELSSSYNIHIRTLSQVGVIEGLINHGFVRLAPYLGPKSRACLKEAEKRLSFDRKLWLVKK